MRPIRPRAWTTRRSNWAASTPGTARNGSSPPTGTRPTSRCSSRWSSSRPKSTRPRRSCTRRDAAGLPVVSGTRSPAPPATREGSGADRSRQPTAHARLLDRERGHGATTNRSRRQRHRGDLQPRDPRAQGRFAAGARRRHRRHPRRQRRGQDHDAASAISNLLQAERGDVTKGSIELRGERIESLTPTDLVQRGVDPGDGGAALLRPPHRRGEPAHRRLHAHGRKRRGRAPTSSKVYDYLPAAEAAAHLAGRLHLGRRAADVARSAAP